MFKDDKGPIQSFTWGMFKINGEFHGQGQKKLVGAGKDILLFDGQVQGWTERQGHVLDIPMVKRAIDVQPETLIIGNGVDGLLECPEEVIEHIRQKGITDIRVIKTPAACNIYNELIIEGRKVALIAHGTC